MSGKLGQKDAVPGSITSVKAKHVPIPSRPIGIVFVKDEGLVIQLDSTGVREKTITAAAEVTQLTESMDVRSMRGRGFEVHIRLPFTLEAR